MSQLGEGAGGGGWGWGVGGGVSILNTKLSLSITRTAILSLNRLTVERLFMEYLRRYTGLQTLWFPRLSLIHPFPIDHAHPHFSLTMILCI